MAVLLDRPTGVGVELGVGLGVGVFLGVLVLWIRGSDGVVTGFVEVTLVSWPPRPSTGDGALVVF